MLKPQFASSISQSANNFFFFIFYFKKTSLVKGPQSDGQRSLSYFSLTCSADIIMLSPHNNPAFLALIPPSFTSLNPFVTFFRPLQPHSSSHNWGKYENSGSTPTLPVIHLFQLRLLAWTMFHGLQCTMVNHFVAGSSVLFMFIEIMETIILWEGVQESFQLKWLWKFLNMSKLNNFIFKISQ